MKDMQSSNNHGSIFSYTLGFLLSIILTFAAYIPTVIHFNSHHQIFSHELLIPLLLLFAFLQLTVQLIFFLHLLQEKKPRWNFIFFISTFALVLLVVVMSIWIMSHLNYNMSPQQMKNAILHDEGIHY
jgi:cytochrome o ubiquinol oxidase operon protein cyoD